MDSEEPNVRADNLKKWQETIRASDAEISDLESQNRSPFRFDESLNRKLAYWIGNIWLLKADAIVCCNNETFTLKTDLITRNTLSCAGRDLVHELRSIIKYCRTSDAVVTSGYNLPSSRVIHVVGPRYSDKYATAAESALHNAYRNVLIQARENNIKTLAIRCIHSSVWKYPSLAGAHVALRTIRRFLERHGDDFDLIVLVVSNNNKESYDNLLPLYFPRSRVEEALAAGRLPKNVGDKFGQLFIPERQIRISAIPYYQITHNDDDDDDDNDNDGGDNDDIVECADGGLSNGHAKEEQKVNFCITDPSFLEMKESVDKERIQRILNGSTSNDARIRRQFYKRVLIRALKEDFTDLIKKRFLFQCGYDKENRPVMLFIAHRWYLKTQEPNKFTAKSLPNLNRGGSNVLTRYFRGDENDCNANDEVSERYRLFFIHQMEALVKQKYVILYVQSLCDKAGSLPSTKCLQSLLGMLDARYINNLHSLYILHSTFTNKIKCWFRLPSVLFQKTVFLKGVEHLYSLISPDELELPEFVLAHDLDLYGVRYYEGQS